MDVESIKREIASSGTQAVLDRLFHDERAWTAVLSGIGRGEVGWLEVAASLRKISDAAASSDLDVALGDALEQAPKVVLETFADFIEDICGNDIVNPASDVKNEGKAVIISLQKREKVVAAVTDPALSSARKRCLEVLRSVRVEREQKGHK